MNKKLILSLILLSANPTTGIAQVVPDDTLPTKSMVESVENTSTITEGTTVGNNLYHSFEQFSLPTGAEAIFNNASSIENIIGRVTGGNVSDIDGLIKANGTSNLFLINPNGIIFGENATLDIGGTFSAVAGDAIKFEDGEFSATKPDNSILSINVPLGVQLGGGGEIAVNGNGSRLFINNFAEPDFRFKVDGLISERINLIGSQINLDGGNVTAPEGILNLVAGTGEVALEELTPTAATTPGNIELINEASLSSSSGSGAGEINLKAANLTLLDGSSIVAINEGEAAPGTINIDATETVTVAGENNDGDFPSYIGVDAGFLAEQNGGILNLNAKDLLIDAGGVISGSSFGKTDGGTLNIKANNIDIISSGTFFSSIIAESGFTGKGGILNLNADRLYLTEGGTIGATTYGNGPGGILNITAKDIILSDPEIDNGEIFAPTILADSLLEGDGGEINLTTENLTVANSAQISASAANIGQGGQINIEAQNLAVTNAENNPNGYVTGILNASGTEPTEEILGDGGNIEINAQNITIDHDALISTRTLSGGDAGSIIVETDNLAINNGAVLNSIARGNGNSGNVEIFANQIDLTSGGQINTGTSSAGNAGDLTINANQINLAGANNEGNSAILSTAVESSGNGGNITLSTANLNLQEGGTISVSNFSTENANLNPGTGQPGTINIESNNINLTGDTNQTTISSAVNAQSGGAININSDRLTVSGTAASISAESLGAGDGGNIQISSNEFGIFQQGAITSSAIALGNAGNINISSNQIEGDRGNIVAESQISGGGDIDITSQTIDLNNNSLVSTSVAESDGGGGDISIINDDFILLRNNSDIRANAFAGPGGNIDIETNTLFQSADSEIDASSQFGIDGDVTLTELQDRRIINNPVLPENQPPSQVIAAACPLADENSFAFVGNGGIPSDDVVSQPFWLDLTPTSNSNVAATNDAKPNKQAQLYNATEVVSQDGELYLVAKERIQMHSKPGC